MRSSLPRWAVAIAIVAVALFVIPLVGLIATTPWAEFGSMLASDLVLDALALSAVASVSAVLISAVLGIPLAWLLARAEFRGKALVRGLVLLPLVVPPIVGGAALLFALGRAGIIGGPLYEATGIVLPFSIWGVIIAATFVSMPFLVITVEAALRNIDRRYEGAAASLGATKSEVFRRVTLPMIRPSLVAGLVLTWARAVGEFGATIAFAGNLQGETQTLPLAVFVALETDRDAAVAISLVMVGLALAVLVGLRDRWLAR